LPDATPTSTDPPSRARRNKIWIAVQILLTAIILWFVGKGVVEQWGRLRSTRLDVSPRWPMLLLAAGLYFAAFLVLIETWRRIVVAWGDRVGFREAARIWLASSLVRYLPYNFVFQVGAFAELSRRAGVSPAAGAGASLINVAVNLASGFIIALVAGYKALDTISNGHASLGVVAAVVLLAGTLALPFILPRTLGLVRSITGRDIDLKHLPVSAIYISLVGNLVAWVLYGLSYRALIAGVIGSATGPISTYIAVYAGAYVVGYLAFVLPAGVGAREAAQVGALPAVGLATQPQALTIAVCARVLSMVIEIVPALVLLSRGTRSRSMIVEDEAPPEGTTRRREEQ
jgi:hypothetical protein